MRKIERMTDIEIISKSRKREKDYVILRVPVQMYVRSKKGRLRYDEIKGSATLIKVFDATDVGVNKVVAQIIEAVTSLTTGKKK